MVRLDDFAVFVNGGGTDDGQVAVRQFGFQYISSTGISLPVVQQSCLIAVITALAAVAGALAAVAVYLHRREKELDEYERLLFGEDDAETVEPEAAEEAPAEDAAE